MAVDKNLFLYDLAIVAIMKNEAHYVKEWLDYHLLAGVEHFYIFDNESTDNLKEVLQPYIEKGIVDYIFYPGKEAQMGVYNEALKNYKFFCRYIAFIDADEFILPKSNKSISEVLDEILADKPNAAALAINWQCFGSNFQDKADYSKGVLERFTRRAQSNWSLFLKDTYPPYVGNFHVKSIVNPRAADFLYNPHFAIYFENYFAVNEQGKVVQGPFNQPVSTEKIVVNHYVTKSKEECLARGRKEYIFNVYDKNEVFDDEILKYRAARRQYGGGYKVMDYNKITAALTQNLAPTLNPNLPTEFFDGKLETFLICRAVCSHLKKVLPDKNSCKILEEAALNAIQKTCYNTPLQPAEVQLLLAELPKILPLDYPVIKDMRNICKNFISLLKDFWRSQSKSKAQYTIWQNWAQLDYTLEILKSFN